MPNINNMFAGVLTFIVALGFMYLIYPDVVSMSTEMPSEVRVFILVIWLAFGILIILGLPFLMVTSSSSDNP